MKYHLTEKESKSITRMNKLKKDYLAYVDMDFPKKN